MDVLKYFELSDEQKEAVTPFGEDVFVEAGAGSGKTTVLAARFLRTVFEKKTDPEKILAITFTDKAAGVMKARLRRAAAEAGDPRLERGLERACISTIHAFCAKTLREHPVEFGVDPAFRVLADGESAILSDACLDRVFEERAQDPALAEILARYGEAEVRAALAAWRELERASGGPLVWREPAPASKKDLLKALRDVESAFSSVNNPSDTAVRNRDAARALAALLSEPAPPDWERLSRWEEAAGGFGGNLPESLKEAVGRAKEAFARQGSLEAGRLGLPVRRALLSLLSRYRDLLDAEKKNAAAYDFEDLLYFTHRALAGKGAASDAARLKLREKYPYILVDEHQDTNPLQIAILDRLRTPGGLFVVGDPKQSIYGFRHAGPEVYRKSAAKSAVRPLRDNYRSRTEILEFVNRFFKDIFGEGAALRPKAGFGPKSVPSVEILAVPVEKDEGALTGPLDRARILEARLLAKRLRALVDSGFRVHPKDGRPRPVEWRDVAVLFRALSNARLYRKEFEALSIPCYSRKGLGFYEKNEIMDLVSLLRHLEHPGDEIALAAVLRSPLVEASDAALYRLARFRREKKISFVSALERAVEAGISAADLDRVRSFLERRREAVEKRDRVPASELLAEFLDRADYEAKILAGPEGRQAHANVIKFLEIARTYQALPGASTGDFARHLNGLEESGPNEREAPLAGEEENVVTFSSIHGAKGLEFPLVVVADLGSKPNADKSFYRASPEGNLGLKVWNPVLRGFYPDADFAALDRERSIKNREEEDRLLYVAMTRAREHLILSGALGDSKNGKERSWMDRIAARVPVEPADASAVEKSGQGFWRASDRPIEPKAKAGAAVSAILERFRPVVKPYDMSEDVTVTRLLETENETAGLEEPDRPFEQPDDDLLPRNEFGTVFHRLMELSVRAGGRGALSKQRFDEICRGLAEKDASALRADLEGFWAGEWGARVRSAARRHPELPFIYKTKHGLLKGQIDLAFETAKDGWTILDYKTNRISEPQLEETAKRYEFQLALYAFVFAELYGEAPKRGVLYFSALGRAFEFAYTPETVRAVAVRLEQAHAALASDAVAFPSGI